MKAPALFWECICHKGWNNTAGEKYYLFFPKFEVMGFVLSFHKCSKQSCMVHQITISKKQWGFTSEAVGFHVRRYTASGLNVLSFGLESPLLRARTSSSSAPKILTHQPVHMDNLPQSSVWFCHINPTSLLSTDYLYIISVIICVDLRE